MLDWSMGTTLTRWLLDACLFSALTLLVGRQDGQSLSVRFNGLFPGEPGLAGVY